MTRMNGSVEDDREVSLLAVAQYFRWVRSLPALPDEEEVALLLRVERGKREALQACPDARVLAAAATARDRLVEGYQPLVLLIAREKLPRFRSMQLLDLVQEGNLGLLRAIEKEEVSKGYPFRYLAAKCIRDAIAEALYERDRLVRVAEQSLTRRNQASQVRRHLQAVGQEGTLEEIASVMRLDVRLLEESLDLCERSQVTSLDELIEEDEVPEDHFVLSPLVGPAAIESPASEAYLHALLHSAVEALPKRRRQVARLRYGLEEEGVCFQWDEIAQRLDMNGVSLRSAACKAHASLREALDEPYMNYCRGRAAS